MRLWQLWHRTMRPDYVTTRLHCATTQPDYATTSMTTRNNPQFLLPPADFPPTIPPSPVNRARRGSCGFRGRSSGVFYIVLVLCMVCHVLSRMCGPWWVGIGSSCASCDVLNIMCGVFNTPHNMITHFSCVVCDSWCVVCMCLLYQRFLTPKLVLYNQIFFNYYTAMDIYFAKNILVIYFLP